MRMDLKDETFIYISNLVLAHLDYPALTRRHVFYAIRGFLKTFAGVFKSLTLEDINEYKVYGFVIPNIGVLKYKYEYGTILKVGMKSESMTLDIYKLIKFLKKNGIVRIYSGYDRILFYNYKEEKQLVIEKTDIYSRFSYLFKAVELSLKNNYIDPEELLEQFPMFYTKEKIQAMLPKDKYANKKIFGHKLKVTINNIDIGFNEVKDFAQFLEEKYGYNYKNAVKNIKKCIKGQRSKVNGYTVKLDT